MEVSRGKRGESGFVAAERMVDVRFAWQAQGILRARRIGWISWPYATKLAVCARVNTPGGAKLWQAQGTR